MDTPKSLQGIWCAAFVTLTLACSPGCSRNANQESDSLSITIAGGASRKLGEIAPGKTHTEQFDIENTNSTVIHLNKKVKTNCGCTSATLSTTELAPGEHATLTMAMIAPVANIADRQATALVQVNEGAASRSFTVGFSYDVRLPWDTVPKTLRLSGRPGSAQQGVILVHRTLDSRASIKNVTLKGLPAVVSWDDFSNNRAKILVKGTMPKSTGIYHGSLSIATNDEDVETQSVDVEYTVASGIRAMPETLLFSANRSAKKTTQRVRLSGDHAVHVEKIRCDHRGVSGRVVAPPNDNAVDVTIDLASFDRGISRAAIVLCLISDGESREETSIPVLVVKDM
jgi:hypothetical protein